MTQERTNQEETLQEQTSTREEILARAGYRLPTPPAPGGNYLSGVVSTNEDGVVTGRAGDSATLDEGYAAARLCALTQLAVLKRHLGSLEVVRGIVSVNGYVSATPGFPDSPRIVNGASDLLVQVFGEAGRHVRAAIGVSSLPRNALVELQMVVEIGNPA